MVQTANKPPGPLVLSSGEPAGIGPDIVVKLAAGGLAENIIVTGDPDLLYERANMLGLKLDILETEKPASKYVPGQLLVKPVRLAKMARCGKLDTANSPYVLECLESAAFMCKENKATALITAPVHKGIINDAGIPFTGHTEWLADYFNVSHVVMMLASRKMRVALATTHLPLKDVSAAIKPERLKAILSILLSSLEMYFCKSTPNLAVLGLNPHAGEGGHLGNEEIDIIEPVLEALRPEYPGLSGPLPADTAFNTERLEQFDAYLAMYHDQGLVPLKMSSFGEAVNITLGLPIIRCSVDHGTALDLAGSGQASISSLAFTLETARQMIRAEANG